MKRKAMIAIWAGLLLQAGWALAGCNTAEGVGKDVERLGEEVQDAVD